MLQKSRGIIFHTVPYSDSRVIAKIYTEEFGLCSFIVTVSRSKKGKIKNSLLQPLTQVDIVADHREKNTLHSIRELNVRSPYQHLHEDIVKTSIALFVAEVLYKSVKEEESNPPLFSFLTHALQILDLQQEGVANFHLVFLVQLSKFLGFYPQSNTAGPNSIFDLRDGIFRPSFPDHPLFVDAPEARILEQLLLHNFQTMAGLPLSGEMRRVTVKHLLRYYELHLNSLHDVKSHHVLEAVLS
jgi:DNA repair protein RecO (recombination protein O)